MSKSKSKAKYGPTFYFAHNMTREQRLRKMAYYDLLLQGRWEWDNRRKVWVAPDGRFGTVACDPDYRTFWIREGEPTKPGDLRADGGHLNGKTIDEATLHVRHVSHAEAE